MTDGQHARPLAPQAHAARHCVVRAAAAAPAAPPPSRSPPESSLGAKRAGATGPLRTDATQHTNGSPLRRRPLEAAAVAQPSACKDAAAGGSSAAAAVRERPGCGSDSGRAAACAVVGGCAAAPGLLGNPDSSTPPGLRRLRSCDRSLACTVHALLLTADGKGDSDGLARPRLRPADDCLWLRSPGRPSSYVATRAQCRRWVHQCVRHNGAVSSGR